MQLHGPCQHDAFDVAADGGVVFRRHGVTDPRQVLFDDRSLVQVGRHVMRRGADQLDAPPVRLMVRLGALEAGQERVVDVDRAPGQPAAQIVRQHLHIPGEHDQIDASRPRSAPAAGFPAPPWCRG